MMNTVIETEARYRIEDRTRRRPQPGVVRRHRIFRRIAA